MKKNLILCCLVILNLQSFAAYADQILCPQTAICPGNGGACKLYSDYNSTSPYTVTWEIIDTSNAITAGIYTMNTAFGYIKPYTGPAECVLKNNNGKYSVFLKSDSYIPDAQAFSDPNWKNCPSCYCSSTAAYSCAFF